MKNQQTLSISVPSDFNSEQVESAEKAIRSYFSIMVNMFNHYSKTANPVLSESDRRFTLKWSRVKTLEIDLHRAQLAAMAEFYDILPNRKDIVEPLLSNIKLHNN